MAGTDPLVDELRQWIRKADNDLINAAHTLKLGVNCPTDTVCFHAQQCVEKYLKTVLTAHGRLFPRTHDLPALVNLLPQNLDIGLDGESLESLTDYATVSRYPGDEEPITLREARATARRARTAIRKLLPKRALRRPVPLADQPAPPSKPKIRRGGGARDVGGKRRKS